MTKRQAGARDFADRIGSRGKRLTVFLLCAGSLIALAPGLAVSAPIKLAIFDFELEDFSAGASTTGETSADAAQLANVTSEVRGLFAQSGRYDLIDVAGADATAKARTLRDCDGCDAAIALKLGAEQSLVGVVRRISRTEYVVRFAIRDAQTGAIISAGDSGLRMGADYSWGRGAGRLIRDRVLVNQTRQ